MIGEISWNDIEHAELSKKLPHLENIKSEIREIGRNFVDSDYT